MTRRTSLPSLMTLASLVAAVLCGCGLKGPLELPERTTNMVIRPAAGTTGTATPGPPAETSAPSTNTPSTSTPGGATPAGQAPGTTPATTAPSDETDQLPPPALPRAQRGGASS